MKLVRILSIVLAGSAAVAQPLSVSVRDFKAVGDGKADDAAAINAATASGASIVDFPRPSVCYKITAPIRVRNGQTLRGHGTQGEGPGICNYGNSDAIRSQSAPPRFVVIEDMNIVDKIRTTRTAGHGINMRGNGSGQFRITRAYVVGHMDGFHIEGGMASSISDSQSDYAKNDSFAFVNASTSMTVSNTYGANPDRYCYFGTTVNYSTFSATACDHAGSDAYHFEGAATGKPIGITFNSPGAEVPKGNGMYLADVVTTVVNALTVSGIPKGTGLAALRIERASNLTLISPLLRDGDYGIRVGSDGVLTSKTLIIINPLFMQNAVAKLLDPLGILKFIP